jgi:signal transduction histidine kinase
MAVLAVVFFSSTLFAGDSCTKEEVIKNYVFVNDFEARTLMHIKPHLIGKVLIALKDDTGKRFFMDFTKKAQSSQATKNGKTYYNGSGWVSYRWPKPGEKSFSPKVTYIKGCLMGDKNVYVGAGYYE